MDHHHQPALQGLVSVSPRLHRSVGQRPPGCAAREPLAVHLIVAWLVLRWAFFIPLVPIIRKIYLKLSLYFIRGQRLNL